ncbi:MAG: hypothetical protein HY327_12070 [Chloroflexi bacterium]|nr:hypothetical protein [Chloroflexota bacterium]
MSEEKKRKVGLDDFVPSAALEHARAARAEMRASFEAFLPPGFVEHRRAARREMLLAVRSLIDAALTETAPSKK